MKEIKLPKNARILVGPEPVDLKEAVDEHRQAYRNALEVLGSALAIERSMSLAVSFFLFGKDIKKREFLEANILGSDWCGFAAKRKVVRSLMMTVGRYTPADIDNFDKAMSKAMKYRNAFAHGEVTFSKEGVTLKYFEGQAIEKKLDESYWDGVVASFTDAHEKVRDLLEKLGVF